MAALVFIALNAVPATAACLSPTDVQDGGMVVYKCNEPDGAGGTAFTEQVPANQTIILKTQDAAAALAPADANTESITDTAAAKLDERLTGDSSAGDQVAATRAPEKKAVKTKSVAKTKKATTKKKPRTKKSKSTKTVHMKKPGLGSRIKYFLFGL